MIVDFHEGADVLIVLLQDLYRVHGHSFENSPRSLYFAVLLDDDFKITHFNGDVFLLDEHFHFLSLGEIPVHVANLLDAFISEQNLSR